MREGSISPNIDRVPNISIDESIGMEMEAMRIVRQVPGVQKVVSRLGRGESPADPAGPNEADVIVTLKPLKQRPGLTQDDIAAEIRQRLQVVPGVNLVMAQPISDRVDEMVTGVRADVAVKVFGDDLELLVDKANEVARVASGIRGMRDTRIDRVGGQHYLNITIDRQAIARHGLNAADVHDVIETAIGGKAATEIYEGERRFQAVVRYPEHLRNSVREIRQVVLNTPANGKVLIENIARVEVAEGPAQINRDSAKRRIVIGVNVQDRDLGGFVAELQRKVAQQVPLPSGYYIEWGGQFHNMERASPLDGRVPLRAGVGRIHCPLGHCGVERRGVGFLHPEIARRGDETGGSGGVGKVSRHRPSAVLCGPAWGYNSQHPNGTLHPPLV